MRYYRAEAYTGILTADGDLVIEVDEVSDEMMRGGGLTASEKSARTPRMSRAYHRIDIATLSEAIRRLEGGESAAEVADDLDHGAATLRKAAHRLLGPSTWRDIQTARLWRIEINRLRTILRRRLAPDIREVLTGATVRAVARRRGISEKILYARVADVLAGERNEKSATPTAIYRTEHPHDPLRVIVPYRRSAA